MTFKTGETIRNANTRGPPVLSRRWTMSACRTANSACGCLHRASGDPVLWPRLDAFIWSLGTSWNVTETCLDADLGRRARRPLLGVGLDEVLEHPPVDGVDEDEPALTGRLLGRVAQDPPRRPAAEAAPHLLRRRVSDREADGPLGLRRAPPSRRRASATPT